MRLPGRILLLAAGLLAACGGSGPVFRVEHNLYDWVIFPAAVDPASDQAPVITDPVVSFRLAAGQRRSALRAGEDWGLGQTRLFGFDIMADRAALGSGTVDISRLIRVGDPGNPIVSAQLSAAHGVTVLGRSCIAPEGLDQWHRVEMRIRLSDRDEGFLEVFCDRKPIWARTDLRTTVAPGCEADGTCVARGQPPLRFEWQMGLMRDHPVPRPVSIWMKRLHHRQLIYVPNRAGNL